MKEKKLRKPRKNIVYVIEFKDMESSNPVWTPDESNCVSTSLKTAKDELKASKEYSKAFEYRTKYRIRRYVSLGKD